MNNLKLLLCQIHNLTASQKAQYDKDGYLIVKNFLDREEVDLLYGLATGDNVLRSNAFDLNDQTGKSTKLTLWFTPGNDTFGLLTRSEKIVNAVRVFAGDDEGEICHFHSKVDAKRTKGWRRMGMAPGLWLLV